MLAQNIDMLRKCEDYVAIELQHMLRSNFFTTRPLMLTSENYRVSTHG